MNKPERTEEKSTDEAVNTPVEQTESTEKEAEKAEESKNSQKEPVAPKQKGVRIKEVGQKMNIGPGNFWNNTLWTLILLIGITFVF